MTRSRTSSRTSSTTNTIAAFAAFVCLAASAAALPQRAAAEPAPRPKYEVLRWKEDWSVLRGQERNDFWDPIKYVPLSKDGRYWVSFGGSLRLRPELWRNFNFGLQPPPPSTTSNDQDSDAFLLTRILMHADLRLGETFRIFLEGKSALATERDLPGGRSAPPLFVDEIDLQNGFLEVKLPIPTDAFTLEARGGREELLLGRQRLVSPLDWANTRRTFDGANLNVSSRRFQAKGFWSRPVRVKKYDFNPSSGDQFFGVYSTMTDVQWVDGFDLYYLGLLADDARFNGTIGSALPGVAQEENRHTMGGRVWGNIASSAFYYDGEFAYQVGDLAGANINAFMFSGFVGRPVRVARRTPKLELGFGYASGDRNPNDEKVETFNQLFPLGHAYLGFIDVIGRQNVIDARATALSDIACGVSGRLDFHYFWRASTDDAVYNAGGAPIRPGNAGGSADVGAEIDLVLSRRFGEHFLTKFGYSHFFAGEFIRQAADNVAAFDRADEDIDFIYFELKYEI